MEDEKKAIALKMIEKAKAILADMPDPQVSELQISRYSALGYDSMRLTLKVGKREFSMLIQEDLPSAGA